MLSLLSSRRRVASEYGGYTAAGRFYSVKRASTHNADKIA